MTVASSPSAFRLRDVLFALAFLAVAAAFAFLAPERLELGQRILGVMGGLAVMFYANAAPKTLTPLAQLEDPGRSDALNRFIAWSLVLGGLGHALAWIVVPFDRVVVVAVAVLGSSLLIALGRCLWIRRSA